MGHATMWCEPETKGTTNLSFVFNGLLQINFVTESDPEFMAENIYNLWTYNAYVWRKEHWCLEIFGHVTMCHGPDPAWNWGNHGQSCYSYMLVK